MSMIIANNDLALEVLKLALECKYTISLTNLTVEVDNEKRIVYLSPNDDETFTYTNSLDEKE